MARQVEWTEFAWEDLEEAANYIAKDSPNYAAAFVREVRDAARSLDQMAERGRVVPELDDPRVRELFVRNYRMIYELTDEAAYIIALVHGSRDLGRQLD